MQVPTSKNLFLAGWFWVSFFKTRETWPDLNTSFLTISQAFRLLFQLDLMDFGNQPTRFGRDTLDPEEILQIWRVLRTICRKSPRIWQDLVGFSFTRNQSPPDKNPTPLQVGCRFGNFPPTLIGSVAGWARTWPVDNPSDGDGTLNYRWGATLEKLSFYD